MEKQNKIAITKGWCIFLAIVGIFSLIGTPSLASMAERITGQSTTTGIGTMVEKSSSQSDNIQSTTKGTSSMVEKSSSQSDNIISDNHGIPPFNPRGTLNVIPYGFQKLGSGTAGWTTEASHTGSYSVKLTTTTATGDYAAVSVNYNLALSGLDSISFWYKHTAYADWCGPRVSIGIDNDVNGAIDHLVISAAVGQANDWTQRNLPTDDDRWWYGTYDPGTGVYTQEGGPVTFAWIKSNYPSAYVRNLAFYMGVVGYGAGAGSVYIDDIAINSVAYYGSIQDAVDIASNGDTINVAAGTYDEQIVIDGKSLTLQGAGDTTIIQPSAPGKLTSIYTYPAGMTYYSGVTIAGIIIAKNVGVTGVTIKNLKVDGASVTSLPTGAARLAGILYGECAGMIQNVAVTTIKTTGYADRTYGIDVSRAGSAVSVELSGNRITDFSRNGIMANGPGLTVNIHDNIITGPGTIGPANVPNGIVLMAQIGGTVIHNTIHSCHYNVPLSYRSVGIMMFDVCQAGVVIDNNEVYDVDDAINTCNECIIRNNNLHNNGFGVVLEWGANNNQIVNNIITGNTNGIQLNGALNPNPQGTDPPGLGNFAHGNYIAGNTMGVVSYDNTQIFDASGNWWGTNTPAGVAAVISGAVDYTPWLDVGTDTSTDPGFQGDFTTLWVDDNSPQTGSTGTIQEGINLVSGSTVNVAAGTYDEQVVIGKTLTIQGAGDSTIIKPSSAAKLTQIFDGLFWYSGTKQIAGIMVANVPSGTSVTIKNLKVDESSVSTKPTGADYLTGIFYRETGGCIDHVSIVGGGAWSGGDRAYGLYLSAATNTVTVEIKDSSITNFDKNGIEAMGSKLTVNVHHNTITGRGPITDEVQNGVDVGRDAVGTVNYNTISNLAYQTEQWWAAGIMFYHYVLPTGKSATAIGNTITDCQIGIIFKNANGLAQDNTVSGVGLIGIYAEPNYAGTYTASFVGNTISVAKDDSYYHDENAAIGANTYDSLTPGTGASLTVTIHDNQLISTSSTSADGISIGVGGAKGSIVATITNNIISNWQYGMRLTGALVNAASSNANFNSIVGNLIYGVYNGGTGTLDASGNWWGTNTPVGVAAIISGAVDYTPWLDVGTDTSINPGFQGDFATLWVDDNSPQTGSTGRIQEGINLVSGSTVNVAAGTYDEQVVIGKTLTIQGAGDSTIIKPSSAAKLTQIFDGLFWYGGTKQIAGIMVANGPSGTSVTIKNLKVDESSVTTKPTGADYLTGIFYRETGGCIDHVSIVGGGAWSLGDRAYGVYLSAATNTVTVEIKDSSITNFDKNGIEAMGDKLSFNIHDNTITGRGPTLVGDEVQNGISAGRGSTGTVNYNMISNLAYQPETWWAAAILFCDSSGSATGNTITNCQIGIMYQDGGGSAQGNTINGGTVGLLGLWAQYTKSGTWTVSFSGNGVSGVRDSPPYENAAVGIQSYDSGVIITATIDNNQLTGGGSTSADGIYIGDTPANSPAGSITVTITNNIVSGWQHGINLVSSVTGATIITGNTIQNNVAAGSGIHIASGINAANIHVNFNTIAGNGGSGGYGVSNGGTGTLDAEYNYWGAASGPTHPGNPGGSGDPVSGNVDYNPWIDTNPPWDVTLNFQKLEDPLIKDTAVFGEKLDALDGRDVYDVPKPGIPPTPYIYAWFDAGLSAPYNKLWKDYRHFPHEEQVWDLYVRANTDLPFLGTTNVVISWSTAQVVASEYAHVDLYDASDVHLADMTTASSYTLTASDDTNIHLKIKCSLYHSITVKQHWNLISLPMYDTISKANIIVRYGGHDHTWAEAVSESIVLVTLYDWQRGATQAYNPTDTLVPGNGYWMWAYHDCELLIASNAVGTGHITDLQTKWNIMGLPYETSLDQALLKIEYPPGTTLTWAEAVAGNIILGFIYGWDSTTQMYTLQTTFEPGQGYWMYAYHDCLLKK